MGPRVASGVRTISPWVRAKVAAAVVPHGQLLNVARQNVVSKITRQIAFNLLVKNILFRDNRRIYGERPPLPRSKLKKCVIRSYLLRTVLWSLVQVQVQDQVQ